MDRVARTIELHLELMQLWGVEHTWNLSISILYPAADAYTMIPVDEIMSGADSDIPIKLICVRDDNDGDYAPITVYRRK